MIRGFTNGQRDRNSILGQLIPKTKKMVLDAIFVSGTSGITSILNYKSVSPIHVTAFDSEALILEI